MGSSSQVVGYKYYWSLLMGLNRGPVDEIVQINVNDERAYVGSIPTTSAVNINAPNLFGGDAKEGGIVGTLQILMGDAAQVLPDLVKSKMAGLALSAFRGVTTMFFDGEICSNNPYPKAWKVRQRRYTKGWDGDPWYPAKAQVQMNIPLDRAAFLSDDDFTIAHVYGMNAAHIIYETMTNRDWGRGLPRDLLDDGAFTYAANVLCSEGFGLCFRWSRTDSISNFLQNVLDHIGGTLYVDRGTGLVTLRLIRSDYDPNSLPVFDPDSGLLQIAKADTGTQDISINEVIVTYHDPVWDQDRTVRAQNVAAIQAQGAISSSSVTYTGCPTPELAGRLAVRDLQAQAPGIKRYKVTLDRRGWKIAPGMPFRVSDPSQGLANLVLRAGAVQDGTLTDGTITIDASADVFGLQSASYITPEVVSWTAPDRSAQVASHRVAYEATYRDILVRGGADATDTVPSDGGAIAVAALRPSPLSRNFLLETGADGEALIVRGNGEWCPGGVLAAPIGLTDTLIALTSAVDLDLATVGEAAFVGGEIVRVDAINTTANTLTVARGCGDTVPVAHAAGELVVLPDGFLGGDGREYATGETVSIKVLTTTNTQQLDPSLAATDTVAVAARHFRPYPPANVTIGGNPYVLGTEPNAVGDVVLAWATRNRVLQQDNLVSYGDASVQPEAGTTYNVRVKKPDGTLLRTAAGLTDPTYTYASGDNTADSAGFHVRFEIEAERDGVVSWQYQTVTVVQLAQAGFGRAFGLDFGGGSNG